MIFLFRFVFFNFFAFTNIGTKSVFMNVMFVLQDEPEVYGLPSDPVLPQTTLPLAKAQFSRC